MGLCWRRPVNRNCTPIALITFCVCFVIYYMLNDRSWSWYTSAKKAICKTPEDEMNDLIELTKDAHIVLDLFNLTHFPVYGR